MFEDTTKQLNESHVLQTQMAERFEESKTRLLTMQNEHEEKLKELSAKLSHYEGMCCVSWQIHSFFVFWHSMWFLEGLVNAYESDVEKKRTDIDQLERQLDICHKELYSAHSEITREKSELSNLEYVRKDLVAQRDLFANDLNDSNMKGDLKSYFLFNKIIFKRHSACFFITYYIYKYLWILEEKKIHRCVCRETIIAVGFTTLMAFR